MLTFLQRQKETPPEAGVLTGWGEIRSLPAQAINIVRFKEGNLVLRMEEGHVFLRSRDITVELVVRNLKQGDVLFLVDALAFEQPFHELCEGEGFAHFHNWSSEVVS